MRRRKKKSQVSRLLERIGLVEPEKWPMHCRWWFKDKEIGNLPCDPYSRQYYLTLGYRPDHNDIYEGGITMNGEQWLHTWGDGVSEVFRGEQEPPMPRSIDLQQDARISKDRLPILIERIRVAIFDEGEGEISGTAQELSERFGYEESAQFGRDVGMIEDSLMEFGIDIDRSRTNSKRHIRIYENKKSGYHPIQQGHENVAVTGDSDRAES